MNYKLKLQLQLAVTFIIKYSDNDSIIIFINQDEKILNKELQLKLNK